MHASVQEKRPFNACTPKACIPKNHFYRQRMLPIKVSSCTLTSLAIVLTALWWSLLFLARPTAANLRWSRQLFVGSGRQKKLAGSVDFGPNSFLGGLGIFPRPLFRTPGKRNSGPETVRKLSANCPQSVRRCPKFAKSRLNILRIWTSKKRAKKRQF